VNGSVLHRIGSVSNAGRHATVQRFDRTSQPAWRAVHIAARGSSATAHPPSRRAASPKTRRTRSACAQSGTPAPAVRCAAPQYTSACACACANRRSAHSAAAAANRLLIAFVGLFAAPVRCFGLRLRRSTALLYKACDAAQRAACDMCLRDATCHMQHVTCNMQLTTCNMQRAACNMQRASMQHATGGMQHAACSMQHATCSMLHAACNMQHAKSAWLTGRSVCRQDCSLL
jgi:hypothetical protein